MKANLFLLLSLVAISITITSCKKEEDTPNGKIKTVTLSYPGGNPGTTFYTYDNEGKLTVTERSDGSLVVYTWTSGLLNVRYYDAGQNA